MLLSMAVLLSGPPAGAQEGWQTLVDGIGYREFSLSGPNRAYVARLDRSHRELIIDSGIALGELGAGKETVSDMAARYDQAMNAWGGTWGNRNRVVVAINGSFYDTRTGVPESGVVHSGAYTKWYGSLQGGSGFAWNLDRQAFIGQCVYHRPEKQVLTYLASGATQPIDGVDVKGEANDLIVITPDAGLPPTVGAGRLNMLVEMERPLLILPLPAMARVRSVNCGPTRSLPAWPSIRWSSRSRGRPASCSRRRRAPATRSASRSKSPTWDPTATPRQNLDWTKTYAGVGGASTSCWTANYSPSTMSERPPGTRARRCASTTTGSSSSSSMDGIPGEASA